MGNWCFVLLQQNKNKSSLGVNHQQKKIAGGYWF